MNRYGVNEPNFLGIIACMTAYNECELWVDEMLEYVMTTLLILMNS